MIHLTGQQAAGLILLLCAAIIVVFIGPLLWKDAKKSIDDTQDELDKMEAENERLAKALKPPDRKDDYKR